eukprot:5894622-Alexandrium_andersonii.AAC.1
MGGVRRRAGVLARRLRAMGSGGQGQGRRRQGRLRQRWLDARTMDEADDAVEAHGLRDLAPGQVGA